MADDGLESLTGLMGVLQEMSNRLPQGVEGTDLSGAVQVFLDADGLPASFDIDQEWTRRLHPTAFGAAVVEAFDAASRARFLAWAQAFDSADLDDADTAGRPPVAPPPPRQQGGEARPRAAADIVREGLAITEDLDAITEAGPHRATGVTASGMLTLTIGSDATFSCSVDQAWLSDKSGAELTEALAVALAAARRDLADSVGASPVGRASRILDEAAAALRLGTGDRQ